MTLVNVMPFEVNVMPFEDEFFTGHGKSNTVMLHKHHQNKLNEQQARKKNISRNSANKANTKCTMRDWHLTRTSSQLVRAPYELIRRLF
ncbi:hypothetical protein Y032_0035g3069 [Ancylostoma ceylanicum]|uniref:Uncharacterized protein n=1 Tax=Ancylostoma ceylanicum TaxID=53326 RepID=A0A016UNA3_9BILA|nr:hypothetical protein Y032_0035g3069 [Ancylostoma ceylanicum]